MASLLSLYNIFHISFVLQIFFISHDKYVFQMNSRLVTGTIRLVSAAHTPVQISTAKYHEKVCHSKFNFVKFSNLQVIDHYENPRNVGSLDKNDPNVGTGIVGAPACGDVMKLQIKVRKLALFLNFRFRSTKMEKLLMLNSKHSAVDQLSLPAVWPQSGSMEKP